ncbi:ABC transporter substrate-binding protein [Devosia epidermidihirudinis]|uniref:ABC transporter substrate-binding protein n=1 Tax=Devosia epidermidihirudinis TaxID=1293439 RepID=A0A0F5QBC5_9HYPH|nr:ABC transporter substrate-binding protein [Devosia epidermidihirudinis]KKC37299.1 ABC transporter substrate-binding protein [Devosia epidermidihirudinis]
MVSITRRGALGLFVAGAAGAAFPRLAFGQDARPSIRIAVPSLPTRNTLDPWNEQSIPGSRILQPNVWEGLLQRNLQGDLEVQPGLATDWKIIDDKIIEVTLRQGVKFHNGDELTAEDVAFSFSRERVFGSTEPAQGEALAQAGDAPKALDLPEALPSYARSLWPSFAGVEVVDRYTVRLHNGVGDLTILGRLAAAGTIGSLRSWNEAGSYAEWARKPVTTAPYITESFEPNATLTMVAFDDYWGGRPSIERITWVEVPEVSGRVNGLLAGDFDFACDLPPDQIKVIEGNPNFEIRGGAVQNARIVIFNKANELIANPLIRRAMTHAIDRQAIVDALWGGRTDVPNGLQFPSFKSAGMYVDGWTNPEYNPDLARSLLQEAGYNGELIKFPISNNYYVNEVTTAQVMAQMWKQVGLNVETPFTDNWGAVIKDPSTGVANWSSGASMPDPISGMVNNIGPGSFIRPEVWSNEEFDNLVGTLETSLDGTERRDAFARMMDIAEREDPAYMVLHRNASFTGVRKDIQWQASPDFTMDFRPSNWG